VGVDEIYVPGGSLRCPPVGEQTLRQRPVVSGHSQDSIGCCPGLSDKQAGGLGQMLEQVTVVAIEPSKLIGKPSLAEHQRPRRAVEFEHLATSDGVSSHAALRALAVRAYGGFENGCQ
jgi:hypothetical protein